MRLNITNDRPHIIEFLDFYFNHTLTNQKVEAHVNGLKRVGTIGEKINFEQRDDYYVMNINFGETKEEIPLLLDKTKIRIGKTLYFFETEKHVTVIEII